MKSGFTGTAVKQLWLFPSVPCRYFPLPSHVGQALFVGITNVSPMADR